MGFPIVPTPANWQNQIHSLKMGDVTYSLRDAWAWAELESLEAIVSSPLNFGGVTTTGIADGESIKELTLNSGETLPTTKQVDGTIILFDPNDASSKEKTQEFIVQGGKYWEFGSTGVLGSFAYAKKGAGSYVDTTYEIGGVTAATGKGTLAVITAKGDVTVATESTALSGVKTNTKTVSIDINFTSQVGNAGLMKGPTITLQDMAKAQTLTLDSRTAQIPNLSLTSTNVGGVEASKVTGGATYSLAVTTYSASVNGEYSVLKMVDGNPPPITATTVDFSVKSYTLVADTSYEVSDVAMAQTVTVGDRAADVTTTSGRFSAYTSSSYDGQGVLTISSSTSDPFLKTVAATVPGLNLAISGSTITIPQKKLDETSTAIQDVAKASGIQITSLASYSVTLSDWELQETAGTPVDLAEPITISTVTAPKYSLDEGEATTITYAPGGSTLAVSGSNVEIVPSVTVTSITPSGNIQDWTIPQLDVAGNYDKATTVNVITSADLTGDVATATLTPALTPTANSLTVTVEPVANT